MRQSVWSRRIMMLAGFMSLWMIPPGVHVPQGAGRCTPAILRASRSGTGRVRWMT